VTAIAFTVHGVAAPAGSKKGFYNPKAKRVIITDDSARSRPWKAQVADAAVEAMQGRDPLDGPLLLEITFWISRPKGHMGSGKNANTLRASAPHAPTVKPDLLKLARGVEDALSQLVYRDDAQITVEILQKAYTTGAARTEIRIVPVADPSHWRNAIEQLPVEKEAAAA
jgi:Holliday junction resolvase RusA-like endonuclease